MNKKHISIYILAASLSLGLSSCKKFTDLTPISDATSSTAYSTASEAEAALTGVYDSYQQEYYIWDNVLFSDVISDNHFAGGDNPEIFAIDKLEITPTNSRLFNNWSQIYGAIAKANVVLQKVPLVTDKALDQNNRRQQILGEALFLRAYHYYQLVNLWGGVPLVLEPVPSTSPTDTHKPRATAEEVFNQIIKDLTEAVAKLPDSYGAADIDKARATKGAANALLAKAYAQKPQKDYNKVLEHANAVINSPAGYQLLDNFEDLFDGAHYNNAESIMEVQFIGGPEANWGPQLLLPPSISGDTWRKFVTPSKDLVAAFDSEGDEVRKDASILFENAPWSDEYWSLAVGGSVPFAYKWKSANGWASTNRQYMLRLADIILLEAEALNELGRTAEARTEVNKIRVRADLDPTTAATQQELRAVILKERRLELAQEAQRWADLKRAGLAVQVMNALNEIDLRTGQKTNYDAKATDLLMPIPQLEMNRNPALVQNPGY
jgi:starch-binding outer membrane protein, SusD/RagB family